MRQKPVGYRKKKSLAHWVRPYMELDTADLSDRCLSRVTMHINKVHHITTIARVAKDLGVDEDWLQDVANEMDVEDGVIWVYGVGDDGIQAVTDFGIENLVELVRKRKENSERVKHCQRGLRSKASKSRPVRPKLLTVPLPKRRGAGSGSSIRPVSSRNSRPRKS